MSRNHFQSETGQTFIRQALQRTRVFEDWDEPALVSISSASRLQVFGQGEAVSRRGEPAGPLRVVAEGVLETSRTWATGRRILLSLLAPGDTTDLAAAFDDQPALCDILARTQATVVSVPRGTLQDAIDRPASPALSMLRALSRQARADAERLHMDLINSPRVRLARTLLRLAAGVREAARGGELDITQDDLAAMLGLSRQSVASAMKPLVRTGLVETGYRSIVLRDLARLREVANEEEPPALRARTLGLS